MRIRCGRGRLSLRVESILCVGAIHKSPAGYDAISHTRRVSRETYGAKAEIMHIKQDKNAKRRPSICPSAVSLWMWGVKEKDMDI